MTIKELAEVAGRTEAWVYSVCRKLGRMPTAEEIVKFKGKAGRKPKYIQNDENEEKND